MEISEELKRNSINILKIKYITQIIHLTGI